MRAEVLQTKEVLMVSEHYGVPISKAWAVFVEDARGVPAATVSPTGHLDATAWLLPERLLGGNSIVSRDFSQIIQSNPKHSRIPSQKARRGPLQERSPLQETSPLLWVDRLPSHWMERSTRGIEDTRKPQTESHRFVSPELLCQARAASAGEDSLLKWGSVLKRAKEVSIDTEPSSR